MDALDAEGWRQTPAAPGRGLLTGAGLALGGGGFAGGNGAFLVGTMPAGDVGYKELACLPDSAGTSREDLSINCDCIDASCGTAPKDAAESP